MSEPAVLVCIHQRLVDLHRQGPVARAMAEEGGGRYDNHHPRAQQARLTGFGARALAAHLNSIEAFPLFAAGVAHHADIRLSDRHSRRHLRRQSGAVSAVLLVGSALAAQSGMGGGPGL